MDVVMVTQIVTFQVIISDKQPHLHTMYTNGNHMVSFWQQQQNNGFQQDIKWLVDTFLDNNICKSLY